MTVLTLAQAKQHLRVDLDFDADDELIQQHLDAAIDYASNYIGRSIPWQGDDGNDLPVPASVIAAIKLIIGDLYLLRENSIVGTIHTNTQTAESLLHMYRVNMGV